MNALVKMEEIKTTPAVISFDFESARAHVVAHLERYKNIVLTADTYKEGKDLIKEINITRKALEDGRKNEVKKASEPIKAFEANMKELVLLHDSLLNNLRDQIEKFEDCQKKEIETLLKDSLSAEWEAKEVRDEFRRASIDHLILLGSITAAGKLASKTKTEISKLATNDLMLQQQTDLRVAHLESACYQAGLAAPLTRQHIQHFIFAPEAEYQVNLNALLQSEVNREKRAVEQRMLQQQREQQRAEAEARIKAEAEARMKIEAEARTHAQIQAKTEEQKPAKPAPEPEEQQEAATPAHTKQDRRRITIKVSFDLSVDARMPDETVCEMLDKKLRHAGFLSHTIIGAY